MEPVLNPALTNTLILKFAIGLLVSRGDKVGFGFQISQGTSSIRVLGPGTRRKKDRVTADDILDSLTRQAQLKQKLEENDSLRLEEIAGTEELIQFQGFNPEPAFPSTVAKKRSFGHLVFVFMLVIGLTVVWLYSLISKPLTWHH